MVRLRFTNIFIEKRRYEWPDAQLNFWLFVMFFAAGTMLGVYAGFMTVQNQLGLGTPWYMPFWVSTGALTLAFIIVVVYLVNIRQLIPTLILFFSFILFVLWLTGLIKISVELWGPNGVNQQCNTFVANSVYTGVRVETLAWLEQNAICQAWKAAFSFALVGTIFFIWMMVIAYSVNAGDPS